LIRASDRGTGDTHCQFKLERREKLLRYTGDLGPVAIFRSQFLPGESIGQVPGGCLRGVLWDFAPPQHLAQFNDSCVFRQRLDGSDFVFHPRIGIVFPVFEAERFDFDFANLFRLDVEEATSPATEPAAA
jgi:hypothetical protein